MVDWENICGKCSKRGHCCCIEPVYVSKKDEKRIFNATGIKGFADRNGLLSKINEKCPFLKNKLCTVHDVAPLDCRAYPVVFWSDAGHGRMTFFLDLDCPMALKLSEKQIEEIKNTIKSEVKNWSEKELYDYDIRTFWKPEKLKKKTGKNQSFPFGKIK